MNRRNFLSAVGLTACVSACAPVKATQKPKYVFLMIGDGMGIAQRQAAETYAQMKFPARNGGLIMNHLPVSGMMTTENALGLVTDSAASGTAMATGVNTDNGILGMLPDKKTKLRHVTEDAVASGMKVGLVSSVPSDHATPASFYAHIKNRSLYDQISQQLAATNVDYVAGEPLLGRKKWKSKTSVEETFQQGGFKMVNDRTGFEALKPGGGKVLVESPINYLLEGPSAISLADMTRKGIELLDGEHGFFMMVEGGKIDWCGHANDLASNVHETLDFNEAVSVAYSFYEKHPQETLIVVTADHETGGLKLENAEVQQTGFVAAVDGQQWASGKVSQEVKRWKKSGMTAPEMYEKLTDIFSFEPLSAPSAVRMKEAIEGTLTQAKKDERTAAQKKMYGSKNMAVIASLHEVAARSGMSWSGFLHTATPVSTTAIGVEAHRFSGHYANTAIGTHLRELVTRSA